MEANTTAGAIATGIRPSAVVADATAYRTCQSAAVRVRKPKSAYGDATAYQFACIYAQWRDIPKALDWIEKAFQLRDPGVISLKTDKFLDPLRKEPRFQQIERSLKFPN